MRVLGSVPLSPGFREGGSEGWGDPAASWFSQSAPSTQPPPASSCCAKVSFYFSEFPTCPDPQLAWSDFLVSEFQPHFDGSGLSNFAAGNRGEECAPAVPSVWGELKRGENEWKNEQMNPLTVNGIP